MNFFHFISFLAALTYKSWAASCRLWSISVVRWKRNTYQRGGKNCLEKVNKFQMCTPGSRWHRRLFMHHAKKRVCSENETLCWSIFHGKSILNTCKAEFHMFVFLNSSYELILMRLMTGTGSVSKNREERNYFQFDSINVKELSNRFDFFPPICMWPKSNRSQMELRE